MLLETLVVYRTGEVEVAKELKPKPRHHPSDGVESPQFTRLVILSLMDLSPQGLYIGDPILTLLYL